MKDTEERKQTRLIQRYTDCRSDVESPCALRRMTKYKKAVRSEVFSRRLVVASIRANTFANAA